MLNTTREQISQALFNLLTAPVAVTGNSHSSTLIDGLANTVGLVPGTIFTGPGVQTPTTLLTVAATSVTLSQPTTTSVAGGLFQVQPFRYASRQVKLWTDVPQDQRPALFLGEHGEEQVREGREPLPITTLDYAVYIYTWAKNLDPSVPPVSLLNPLLDLIDSLMASHPVTGNPQNLGGLVDRVWQEGRVIKEPGDLDGDGLAIVPLKVLVPAVL
jgi:hypothetical protein